MPETSRLFIWSPSQVLGVMVENPYFFSRLEIGIQRGRDAGQVADQQQDEHHRQSLQQRGDPQTIGPQRDPRHDAGCKENHHHCC